MQDISLIGLNCFTSGIKRVVSILMIPYSSMFPEYCLFSQDSVALNLRGGGEDHKDVKAERVEACISALGTCQMTLSLIIPPLGS